MITRPTETECQQRADELHQLDRTHYDTPASIKHCACDSCNESRERFGKPAKRWERVQRRFVVDGMYYRDRATALDVAQYMGADVQEFVTWTR